MPQENNQKKPPEPKGRKPRVTKIEGHSKCHIHDKVLDFEVDEIRANVCLNDEPLTEFEGKYYCLFHLPTQGKNIEKFEEKFRTKLNEIEEKLIAIKELPEAERENTTNEISYDFRYVRFPSETDFVAHEFSVDAYFSKATFAGRADFSSAIFSADADFRGAAFAADADFVAAAFAARANFSEAAFSAGADFSDAAFSTRAVFGSAKFSDDAYFIAVTFAADSHFSDAAFSADAYFRETTFAARVDFNLSQFAADADFGSAKFLANVHFNKTVFSETGITKFTQANFAKDVFFDETEFRNKVRFNAVIFGIDTDVFFRDTFFAKKVNFQYCTAEGYLRFSRLRQGKDCKFDFQEAAFEKATRISFHTAWLLPHWFVNVDATKFVFTNCQWKSPETGKISVKSELDALHSQPNSHKLLTKTCWQLADNHEEMKSFPKASNFRKFANESKRLEDYGGWKIWSWHWWYWLSSFYGESPLRAGLVLAGILLFFTFAFMFTDFQICPMVKIKPEDVCKPQHLNFLQSALQSLATATFQNIEYIKPNSMGSTFLIILEKILAPLQAALLALAIRRKFMR